MAYILSECIEGDIKEMDKIWGAIWTSQNIEGQLKQTENDDLLPIFFKYLPKSGPILEGGCGLARWVIYLQNKGYNILGLEYSKETVDAVKRYDRNVPIEFGNITNTRFMDDHFDAYISLGVVEHFENGPDEALREARRILRPGGLLLISIPTLTPVRRFISYPQEVYNLLRENKYVRALQGKKPYPQKHFFEIRYSIKEFDSILKRHGFLIYERFPYFHTPFGLLNYCHEPPSFISENKLAKMQVINISKALKKISKWLAPGGILWVCTNSK